MVLGKLPVPGRPTNLDKSRTGACCAYSRCEWGLFGHFFSLAYHLSFLIPLSGRRPDIDEILAQRAVKHKTTNQPFFNRVCKTLHVRLYEILAYSYLHDKLCVCLCTPSLNVLLSGDSRLDNHTNETIFLAVQRFIDESRRFHA